MSAQRARGPCAQTCVRDNVRLPMTTSVASATGVDPLGPRIRALREAMDLSLRDLAERSGVSAPMLSQVERGETSPTLQVAGRIAAGLELRLSQLLRLDEDGAVTIVRRGERRQGPTPAAARPQLRDPDRRRCPGQRAELSRHTLAPGRGHRRPGRPADARARAAARRRSSSRAAVVLLCDGARHELRSGDCVTFDADLPHHFENPGTEEAVLLAVVSAGLRRS